MSVAKMPLFSVPYDVPPALEFASGLLHSLVDRVTQLETHQNPQKTLHLAARCIEIFEGSIESFREPPSTFEGAAEALGSLSHLESLAFEAIAVLEAAPPASSSSPPRIGHPSQRDWTDEQLQNTWMSRRNALVNLLVKAHATKFKPSTNWQTGVEEVKRVDDFLWATVVAQSMQNRHSDPSGSVEVESIARQLLGPLDEDTRNGKLSTVSSLSRRGISRSTRHPHSAMPVQRAPGTLSSRLSKGPPQPQVVDPDQTHTWGSEIRGAAALANDELPTPVPRVPHHMPFPFS